VHFETKFAYVGLTQACKTTRSEFQNLWLENTVVPLPLIDRFIDLFLTDGSAAYTSDTGTLQVFIEDRCQTLYADIRNLVHFKARCPEYKVVFYTRLSATGNYPDTDTLSDFINFSHPTWRCWIMDGGVEQIKCQIHFSCFTSPHGTKEDIYLSLAVHFKEQPKGWREVKESMMTSLRVSSWDPWDPRLQVDAYTNGKEIN
jgi:hypothetical protein